MIQQGRAHRFGDDVSTDDIIPEHYKARATDVNELARFAFVEHTPGFANRMKRGDLVVGGRNFGCGSAREAAPHILKVAGVSCVLAQSFGRIFFRNAINIGLPIAECDTSGIRDGDEVAVDLASGTVRNLTLGTEVAAAPLPSVMAAILQEGGIAGYLRKHGDLVLPS
jgi:3-isopropylmalate/(R)-2-methylmalate dehydratase small subunit